MPASGDRFADLARELSQRDRDLGKGLVAASAGAERLQRFALACVDAFRGAVRSHGADHLANVEVGACEADAKHVDAVSFSVRRGRWEAVCVAKARGQVTLVGPYKRGKTEKPCADHPLDGAAAERGLEDLIEQLIRRASER